MLERPYFGERLESYDREKSLSHLEKSDGTMVDEGEEHKWSSVGARTKGPRITLSVPPHVGFKKAASVLKLEHSYD